MEMMQQLRVIICIKVNINPLDTINIDIVENVINIFVNFKKNFKDKDKA